MDLAYRAWPRVSRESDTTPAEPPADTYPVEPICKLLLPPLLDARLSDCDYEIPAA